MGKCRRKIPAGYEWWASLPGLRPVTEGTGAWVWNTLLGGFWTAGESHSGGATSVRGTGMGLGGGNGTAGCAPTREPSCLQKCYCRKCWVCFDILENTVKAQKKFRILCTWNSRKGFRNVHWETQELQKLWISLRFAYNSFRFAGLNCCLWKTEAENSVPSLLRVEMTEELHFSQLCLASFPWRLPMPHCAEARPAGIFQVGVTTCY